MWSEEKLNEEYFSSLKNLAWNETWKIKIGRVFGQVYFVILRVSLKTLMKQLSKEEFDKGIDSLAGGLCS